MPAPAGHAVVTNPRRPCARGRLWQQLVILAVLAVGIVPRPVSSDSVGSIAEFPISGTSDDPHLSAITSGPGGNLWVTETGTGKIASVSPSGSVTEFPLPSSAAGPRAITTGPDGNLWIAETSLGQVARMSPSGTVAEFALSWAFSEPTGIARGPDGNLWVVECGGGKIARVTPSGSITEFPVSSLPVSCPGSAGVAAGPDGNLWFSDVLQSKIGRITPSGVITEFPTPTPNTWPSSLTAGPDGNLWFLETGANRVGRITPAGVSVDFAAPSWFGDFSSITAGSDGNLWFTTMTGGVVRMTPGGSTTVFLFDLSTQAPGGITTGPDGNLWFTEVATRRIGRLTPSGSLTEFAGPGNPGPTGFTAGLAGTAGRSVWLTLEDANAIDVVVPPPGTPSTMAVPPTPHARPHGVIAGPDGNLWFTERGANQIAMMGSSVARVTEYPIPTANSQPSGIASGSDGNLWFTESAAGRIGRITPTGTITEFELPSSNSHPDGIAPGPDGNLWFAEGGASRVGRITPAGQITEFVTPTQNSQPAAIVMGADSNLWFTESGANRIGRIVPSTGAIAEFVVPTADSQPSGIASGPDGNVWFTETAAARIGRISPAGAITEFPLPSPSGQPTGITAGPDGNLWFGDRAASSIGRITADTVSSLSPPAFVTDGLSGQEERWTNSPSTLSARWSSVPGAASYEVALGVSPFDTSLRPYTNVGAVTQATLAPALGTLLTEGGSYFVTVRARDGANLPTGSATSPGSRLDLTPPSVAVTAPSAGSVTGVRQLTAEASDALSGVLNVQFQRSSDGTTWTNVGSPIWHAPYQLTPSNSDLPDGLWHVRAVATDVAGNVAASTAVPFTLITAGPVRLLSQPVRLADTRTAGGPIASGASRCFAAAGLLGVPAEATGVVLNVTAVGQTTDGWLTAYPSGQPVPATSTLNFATSEYAVANGMIARLGADGQVCVNVGTPNAQPGSAHVILDATGYLTALDFAHLPMLTSPQRLADTRAAGGAIATGTSRCFQVAGVAGLPSDAAAVVLNVTAVGYATKGWLTVYPSGQSVPATSTLNFDPTEYALANGTVARLGPDGQVCVNVGTINAAPGSAQVVLDATGYLTAAGLVNMPMLPAPRRLIDTRTAAHPYDGPIASGTSRCFTLTGLLTDPTIGFITGVVLNVTAVGYGTPGWLTVYPPGEPVPGTSTLNFDTSEYAMANGMILDFLDGEVCVSVGTVNNAPGGAHVIIDAIGTLAPTLPTPSTGRHR